MNHTELKLPLHVLGVGSSATKIIDAYGERCMDVLHREGYDSLQSANLIVTAVNHFDKAVECLKAAMDYIDQSPCDPDIYPEQWKAWCALQDLDPEALIQSIREQNHDR